jgi:hypothetical protein
LLLLLRTCRHELKHPDPDQGPVGQEWMHECDGCCTDSRRPRIYSVTPSFDGLEVQATCFNDNCPIIHFRIFDSDEALCPYCGGER